MPAASSQAQVYGSPSPTYMQIYYCTQHSEDDKGYDCGADYGKGYVPESDLDSCRDAGYGIEIVQRWGRKYVGEDRVDDVVDVANVERTQ